MSSYSGAARPSAAPASANVSAISWQVDGAAPRAGRPAGPYDAFISSALDMSGGGGGGGGAGSSAPHAGSSLLHHPGGVSNGLSAAASAAAYNNKYDVLRSIYERRIKSLTATITKTLAGAASGSTPLPPAAAAAGGPAPSTNNADGSQDGSSSSSASTAAAYRVARIIEAVVSGEREEELIRLQEEVSVRDAELAALRRCVGGDFVSGAG